VAELRRRGVSRDQMTALLQALRVELVITAHPTEAKRRSVLSKLQRIAATLADLHRDDLLPQERAAAETAIRAEITALWLTDRSRTARPEVTDEVRTGLYFVEHTFWDVLPRVRAELVTAVAEHYAGLAVPRRWLGLASWIGGDRDGNPHVTAAVTAETLRLHRGLAVVQHRRALRDLARRFSLSDRRLPLTGALQTWLAGRRPLPERAAYLERRYGTEPYRVVLSLLAADLGAASTEDMTARLLEAAPHQARAHAAELGRRSSSSRARSPRHSPRTASARSARRSICSASTPRVSTSARTPVGSPRRSSSFGAPSGSPTASPHPRRPSVDVHSRRCSPPHLQRPETRPTAAASTTRRARHGPSSGCWRGPAPCTGPGSSGRS
jgi:hypothetical protein